VAERQYCRAVSGFGWPQGYPEPCGPDDNPTSYRDNRSGPWIPMPPPTTESDEI